MKTFAIHTLGCKVNQYESQQIGQLLAEFGLIFAPAGTCADLVVINTCCVTSIASSKSRQSIRKAQKLHPSAAIVIAGCLPAGDADEMSNIDGNVHVVAEKDDLAKSIEALITSSNAGLAACDTKSDTTLTVSENINKNPQIGPNHSRTNSPPEIKHKAALRPLKFYSGQSRAFLKVQDGCDGYCSYCIIPKIRKNVCNKNVKTILEETANLVKAGHKEIVLTGIFLGAYGHDTVRRKKWPPEAKNAFTDMLEKVAAVEGLARIRLSSLEPGDVTEKLLDVFCRHRNIMPHLHLPLQSGSQRILKKMCRQYNIAEFLETIERVRTRLDRPAITTDIIVGFPGETDEDFQQTYDFAKKVAFSKIHVFSFSPRKNTPAAKMHPTVDPRTIKERSKRLRNLDTRLQKKFRDQFIGQTVPVLIEKVDDNTQTATGRCERYFPLTLTAADSEKPLEIAGIVETTVV
ncbi:MAG TPA: tRNA (N(6)-L-threonylcarbamoyladenosine(37)-C(2))-methylthiotransferase MtaB [Phycisphaerales bacterium]|nr:tRNA (N(6)-L-threonylcarbamoyladenosine(37)-C(2))-methylthiotransferase MtaB [Phycisphaerales bacterium]